MTRAEQRARREAIIEDAEFLADVGEVPDAAALRLGFADGHALVDWLNKHGHRETSERLRSNRGELNWRRRAS